MRAEIMKCCIKLDKVVMAPYTKLERKVNIIRFIILGDSMIYVMKKIQMKDESSLRDC